MAGEQQLTRWMFSSSRDYRTYLSPLQLKGTVELVAVTQLSSYQPSKPFLLFGHGAHSHVSSAEARLCPRGTKCVRETMERTFTTLLPFFSFYLLLLLLEYQAGASAEERGEGHQKEKREMTGVRSLRLSALCWLASLTARRE